MNDINKPQVKVTIHSFGERYTVQFHSPGLSNLATCGYISTSTLTDS